jgi:hypothetical protein
MGINSLARIVVIVAAMAVTVGGVHHTETKSAHAPAPATPMAADPKVTMTWISGTSIGTSIGTSQVAESLLAACIPRSLTEPAVTTTTDAR